MTQEKLHFADIRYNPETCAFETRVTLHAGDIAYVYPVHVAAPMTADYAHVMRSLSRKARILHRSKRFGMRLTRPVSANGEFPPHPRAA